MSGTLLIPILGACSGDSAVAARPLVVAQDRQPPPPPTGCALVLNKGDEGFREEYRYNADGLVGFWVDQFGGQASFVYDNRRRLKNAVFTDGVSTYNIDFVYKGGRIVRELAYDAATGALADIVVNSYNETGQLVRRESYAFDFYATFAYDAVGNAYQVDVLGVGGYLYIATTFSFTMDVKNPNLALHGLPYGVPYINQVHGPWRQTAAKSIITDANGDPLVLFDQDPYKSILRAGSENYAVYQSLFDKLSQTFFNQKWEYQNCLRANALEVPAQLMAGHRPGSDLRVRGGLSMSDQIAAMRKAFGR